MKETWFDVI